MKTPFVLDCDTGRDDALTIWLALLQNYPLKAVITSFGNVDVAKVTDNTLRVLDYAQGQAVPVWEGAQAPLKSHKLYTDMVQPRQKASANGLCNIETPLSKRSAIPKNPQERCQALDALAQEHGALNYLIIGPATNFSEMVIADNKSLRKSVKSVYMMGGKLDKLWNEMPGADFNIAADPEAVQTIIDAGYHIHFIPMNITWEVKIPVEELSSLQTSSSLGKMAKDLMIAHSTHFSHDTHFRFHDPVAMLSMAKEGGFVPVRVSLNNNSESADYGRLITADGEMNAFLYDISMAEIGEMLSFIKNSFFNEAG